jgi:hypothetical protein
VDPQKQIENYRILAKNALDGGDGQEALTYYNKILELDPSTVDAWAGKCTAQAFLGTLDSPEVSTMLSAAKSAVRFSAPEAQSLVRNQMARLLLNYCEQMVKGARKSSMQENEDSKGEGFLASLATALKAEARRSWRVRQIYPIIELAVEFAPKDADLLRQAIGLIDLGLEFMLIYNDEDRAEEDRAKSFSARCVGLMRAVEPGFMHFPRKWDPTKPAAQTAACFASGSRVLTPAGWRSIESLQQGDEVLSWHRGALVPRVVEKAKKHGFRNILEVEFIGGGSALRVTPNHKVLRSDGRWVRVDSLVPGSVVAGSQGAMVVATVRRSAAQERVYNLITSEDRNFVVEGVVAHSFGVLLGLRMFFSRSASALRSVIGARRKAIPELA